MSTILGKLLRYLPLLTSSQDNREDLAVMMTLGRCEVASPGYECPCKAGKYVSATGVLDQNMLWASCSHPLLSHSKFVGRYHPSLFLVML